MVLGRVAVVTALMACVASLKAHTELRMDPEPTGIASKSRMEIEWGATRLGVPMLESEACSVAYNFSFKSEWTEEAGNMPQHIENRAPKKFMSAGIGCSRVMYPMEGIDMEYQLFIPDKWSNDPLAPYPVVVVLHSHPARNFSVMNTEGLPRMLNRNQSTSFDNRSCWCLDMSLAAATTANETNDLTAYDNLTTVDRQSPMADCDFADNFPAIVVMPQGWAGKETSGWTSAHFEKITGLTRAIMLKYNGNADNVVLIGSAEGGKGALEYASSYPDLFSGVGIFDSPDTTISDTTPLEGKLVWVTGDSAAGTAGNDALVVALKKRTAGVTRYYRYLEGPTAADPGYANASYGHTYDIITRDLPGFWASMWHNKQEGGRAKWDMGPSPFVHLGPQPVTLR